MKPVPVFEDPDCPVPIIQGAGEFERLLKLYKHLKPTRIVEIGSLFGGTLFEFMKNTPSQGLYQFISIDLPVNPDDSRYEQQMMGHRYLWSDWADNFSNKKKKVELVDVLSRPSAWCVQDVVQLFGTIDFLFIDGSHRYQDAKLDWEFYRPYMTPTGVIAFHDIYRHTAIDQVWQLWEEIKAEGYVTREFSTIEDQDDWGIGVVFL